MNEIEFQEHFIKANTELMEALGVGDVILRVCTTLPSLSKYYQRYEDTTVHGKPLFLPIQTTDATVVKNSMSQMSADMSILSAAVSLPILEPLTPSKIKQLSQCEMSALYCAVLTSIAGSVLNTSSSQKSLATTGETEESGDEDPARNIVDKALEIFNTVGDKFKTTREHIYQNHLMSGAWLLVSGIQGAMGASGSNVRLAHGMSDEASNTKGKSPSRSTTDASSSTTGRVNLVKVQQGFGVLNAAIANHTLIIMTELIGDLVDVEPRSDEDKATDPADFDIMGKFTSLQRVIRVLNTATMQQLLTFLATVSYRKACQMKRVNIKSDGGDPVSYSDSTTYYNDTICSSEDSESDEEDSYLGIWFKETLSPELKETPVESATQEKSSDGQRGCAMVPAKDEPHEYLELSAEIFSFLDTSLGSNHKFLNKYVKSGLSEQQMVLLANILKDLDRDASARGDGDLCDNQWQGAMNKFAGSLGRYLHNLLSGSLVSESLQSALLLHLGVSPWTQDSIIWPLQVYSRTLSVLVQILVRKRFRKFFKL